MDADRDRDAGRPRDTGALEACELPVVVGSCHAAMERWAWNPVVSACQAFTYGGCDGNANNFETPQACLEACAATVDAGRVGAACKVGDRVFPPGVGGFQDPFSCNTCACDLGSLLCTKAECPRPCRSGTQPATQCVFCGASLACQILEHACLPRCVTDADCGAHPGTFCTGATCELDVNCD